MRYRFEAWELDTDRRELRRGGTLVAVEPRALDLLIHLVRYRQRVVSRDELISSVWQGRIVSESAMATCINASRAAIGDSGKSQRLIKTLPRKGLRFVGAVEEGFDADVDGLAQTVDERAQTIAQSPDRPSIAILPFVNLSTDVMQEYFADGIVDDIITELSRMRLLLVIARNSSFTYKGRDISVQRIGQELSVQYVLQGSVRRAADRLRITAQLIETSTGSSIWADRFEGELDEIFALQDRIARGVAIAAGPMLEWKEITKAQRKPTNNLTAYDNYLRGLASYYQWTEVANLEALSYFKKAVSLDPQFAIAYGMAARCYAARAASGWSADTVRQMNDVRTLTQHAILFGKDDAVALATAGFAIARILRELEEGARHVDRALALDPNLAVGWQYSGWIRVWLGEPDRALDELMQALRLNPLNPQIFTLYSAIASAHLIAGRHAEAIKYAEVALHHGPDHVPGLRILVSGLGLAGRLQEAKKIGARLRAVDPGLRLSNVEDRAPYRRQQDLALHVEGLRRAGISA